MQLARELTSYAPPPLWSWEAWAWDQWTTAGLLLAAFAFLIANTLGLLAFSLLSRRKRERREAAEERLRKEWQPVLYERIAGEPEPLPALARRDRLAFLVFVLHMMGYVRDDALEALAGVALELGLQRDVLKLLKARAGWKRDLGMRAAGAFKIQEAKPHIARIAALRQPQEELQAVRAMLACDPQAALVLLEPLLKQGEWSPEAMAGVATAGGEPAIELIGRLIMGAPPGGAKRLARLAAFLENGSVLAALRERLLGNRDDEELATLLHAIGKQGGPRDRAAALVLLAHRSWLVRMQAAAALGSIGVPGDEERLVPLLSDRQWWVRYRSAQALRELVGIVALRALRDRLDDRYAREMVDRALAEA